MRVLIEFNLPEESEEHRLAVNAGQMQMAIQDFGSYLRQLDKYVDHNGVDPDDLVSNMRDEFHRLLGEYYV